MEKLFVKNRKGQKVSVLVEQTENQKGLAFVMHGLGGFKEQEHIEVFATAFQDHGFTVVRFDTTNTLGESDGNYEDATVTNYHEDLEDVISWSKEQEWYQEPFWLAGHSLGGISTALYAEMNPDKVCALAPISSVISGELTLSQEPKDKVTEWNKTGWKISPSKSKPGVMKRLNWRQFVGDSIQYDLLKEANKLTMPVLLITGSEDSGTPYKHQKLLYDKLPGLKEIHVIEGVGHNFREEKHLREIRELFGKWIKKHLA